MGVAIFVPVTSPVRRRVAQAGQGMSARTDETTSHSTKLANGYA